MNESEKALWLQIKSGNLFISQQFYHHHAFEIVKAHESVTNELIAAFSHSIALKASIRDKKLKGEKFYYPGINANHLNKQLRLMLQNAPIEDLRFEAQESRGVFHFSSGKGAIGGFDFAVINHFENLVRLRNLCFGEYQYHSGIKQWNRFLKHNPELDSMAQEIVGLGEIGKDVEVKHSLDSRVPLIVGEIQFGNWALVYRDFFKVLKANVQNNVDCLMYVVPTGKLESLLSDGIVTFEKTKKVIEEFEKVINVPVWLVGVDLDL